MGERILLSFLSQKPHHPFLNPTTYPRVFGLPPVCNGIRMGLAAGKQLHWGAAAWTEKVLVGSQTQTPDLEGVNAAELALSLSALSHNV